MEMKVLQITVETRGAVNKGLKKVWGNLGSEKYSTSYRPQHSDNQFKYLETTWRIAVAQISAKTAFQIGLEI